MPRRIRRLNFWVPVFGAIAFLSGFHLMREGFRTGNVPLFSLGLMSTASGLAAVVTLSLAHFIVSREVRFTLDRMIVRQTGRADLILPYSAYQREWVADLSNERLVRIITFGRNRGCTIVMPPDWLLDALREIARIQQEEGWYEPAEATDRADFPA